MSKRKEKLEKIFEPQRVLLPWFQYISELFYPEVASFTGSIGLSRDILAKLADSSPILMRRDLGNFLGSMLRDGEQWFRLSLRGQPDPDEKQRQGLDALADKLRSLMYSGKSGFNRATREADQFYVTFGNAVISVEPDLANGTLLYRTHHLSNCAWMEDYRGDIRIVARRFEMTGYDIEDRFPKFDLPERLRKDKMKKAEVAHIVERIEPGKWKSIYFLIEDDDLLEEVEIGYPIYVIPRFATIPDSPYAYSPVVVTAVPDSTLLETVMLSLLDAAERVTNPPLTAVKGAIHSEINLRPNGVTWIDRDYDERTGKSLNPVDLGNSMPYGMEVRELFRDFVRTSFYLDRLSFPDVGDMTAYEVAQRMKQFRRETLPLFAPVEEQYNAPLCEASLLAALSSGLILQSEISEDIRGQDVIFEFDSPLTEQEEEKKRQVFLQASEVIATAGQFDQEVIDNLDFDKATRDTIIAIGAPSDWVVEEDEVIGVRQQRAIAMQQAAAMAAQAQQQGVDNESVT